LELSPSSREILLYGAYAYKVEKLLRNNKNIISSISVTDIVFDDYLGEMELHSHSQSENLKLFYNCS